MIVLNEIEYAEKILQTGEIGSKPSTILFILGKYYRHHLGYKKSKIIHELDSFMSKYYKNYNPVKWADAIEDIAKKSSKYELVNVDYIPITKSELTTIKNVKNIKLEKLMFSLLCYAKFYNIMSETNNNWSNITIKELFRTSRVALARREDKYLLLNDLLTMEYIHLSNKNENLNIKVNYVSTEEDDEIVAKIDDIRELGYEYLRLTTNKKFKNCESCGILTIKRANSIKYCQKCSKKIESENAKIRMKELRKNKDKKNVTK